jgi:hypothetical protein
MVNPFFTIFFNAKVATLKEQRAGVCQEKKETLVPAGPRPSFPAFVFACPACTAFFGVFFRVKG